MGLHFGLDFRIPARHLSGEKNPLLAENLSREKNFCFGRGSGKKTFKEQNPHRDPGSSKEALHFGLDFPIPARNLSGEKKHLLAENLNRKKIIKNYQKQSIIVKRPAKIINNSKEISKASQ